MFGVFISVLQFVAITNAFVRSARERFLTGAIGALLRGALLISGVIGEGVGSFRPLSGSDVPAPNAAALMALAATFLGPVVSLAVIWIAHRRMQDVPAAQEERLSRPFKAWLPVALFDAAFVVINVLATLISNRF